MLLQKICFAFALVVETRFQVQWLFCHVWNFSWITKLPTECSRTHVPYDH